MPARQVTVLEVARHRNGIGGAPFHVVRFTDAEEGPMLGIVFDQAAHCAVFSLPKLAQGTIAFGTGEGGNSWRGDQYEPALRRAVAEHDSRLAAAPEAPTTACGDCDALVPVAEAWVNREGLALCGGCFTKREAKGRARPGRRRDGRKEG